MTPGPTHVPDRVLRAMQRPAVDLAAPDFVALCRSCLEDLKPIFKTAGHVFIYAANGHGAWEAAIANTLSPGDRILVPESGHFAGGWARMAEQFGVVTELIPGDWRHGIDPVAVEEHLRRDANHTIKAVFAIHTDTASGITSDIAAVRNAMNHAGHPALLMVDAVASLTTVDFPMDEWAVDVAVGASQKGLMSPPGLSFNAVSHKALRTAEHARSPRGYWDWHRRLQDEWYTWFCGTAPEHLIFALREALDMVTEEGLDAIFVRHQRLADTVRAAIAVWAEGGGLEFNALSPAQRSNSVSTVLVREPWSAASISLTCRDRFNVSLGGGLGNLSGKAFRIAHMGDTNEPTILGALASVEAALEICRVPHGKGGVRAAIDYLVSSTPAAEA